MSDPLIDKQVSRAIFPEVGGVASLLNFPMTPYVLGTIVWLLAWWVQMGPLRPVFNFVPGVELPFFPAGVRTLAVFAFGFPGAVGIFIGSVATYFLYFPEMSGVSTLSVLGCSASSASSAFSAYLAMRLVCDRCGISDNLSGLTVSAIGIIVLTQSVLSASLHQFFYLAAGVGSHDFQVSLGTLMFHWSAMAVGDALGSMSLLFMVLIGFQILRGRLQKP